MRLNVRTIGLLLVLVMLAALLPGPAMAQGGGGGTLIGAFDVGPGGAPQVRPFMDTAGRTWLIKIFTPLLSWNEDATGLAPQLAVDWSSNEDATVWTFNLREGVLWHDGEPFTADDVRFSLELAFNPAAATGFPSFSQFTAESLVGGEAYVNGEADHIEGIVVVDDLTIEFHLVAPKAQLPFSMVMAWVLPEHALADLDPAEYQTTDWFYTNPIGTGPFMHDEFEPDQFWALVPNPNYWDGAPLLDRLINRYFEDETAAILALQNGDIHFTYASSDVALSLQGDPNFVIHSGSSGVTNYLIFNLRNPAFQDVRVRQAFLYAIDRQAIADTIRQGTVQLVPCISALSGMWPPAEELNAYEYDPEVARQLLADAGWDSSVNYDIHTYYTSQTDQDTLAAFQAYLADVGVQVTPLTVDVPTYNSYFYSGEGWDISYRGVGATLLYPWQFYSPGGFPDIEDPDETLIGPAYPELMDLMAQAQAETDTDTFLGLMQDICAFQNENALEGYVWTSIRYGVGSNNLADFYWFPAQGGGPYVDHAELWAVAE
ncbi:MAG: ABC transporter substrate-binding protein [Anaerolineae bacterium]|nr:ABC transporter substrate-binding protein [Anaerolineae bacterium]